MQQANRLQFNAGDRPWAVIALQYSQSLDALCGHFSVRLDPANTQAALDLLGNEVTISGQGWQRWAIVEQLSFDAPHQLTLAGRDRVSVVADASVEAIEFAGRQGIEQIAAKLVGKLGITVLVPAGAGALSNFSVNAGETAFDALERAARRVGGTWGSPDGKTLRLGVSSPQVTLGLSSASPIISFQTQYDYSERFGTYEIKVTPSLDLFSEQSAAVATSSDPQLPTHKKKIIRQAHGEDFAAAQARVHHEQAIRSRRSVSFEITLAGHHPVQLGTVAEVALFGFHHRGLLTSLQYELATGSETTCTTTLTIGGHSE